MSECCAFEQSVKAILYVCLYKKTFFYPIIIVSHYTFSVLCFPEEAKLK